MIALNESVTKWPKFKSRHIHLIPPTAPRQSQTVQPPADSARSPDRCVRRAGRGSPSVCPRTGSPLAEAQPGDVGAPSTGPWTRPHRPLICGPCKQSLRPRMTLVTLICRCRCDRRPPAEINNTLRYRTEDSFELELLFEDGSY